MCEVRHAFPNILAVDFATVGDVVKVADALNGVGGAAGDAGTAAAKP
jgi:hypothetical protein